MSMSLTVENYLQQNDIHYSLLKHPYSSTSMETAHSAHVMPAQLAKAVIVKDESGYLMCVIPASHILVMSWLNRDFAGHFHLVDEREIEALFTDCDLGAIPVLGQAYGMRVVWDNAFRYADDLFFEAGDHCHLVHLRGSDFIRMMQVAQHATLSCAPEMEDYYRYLH